MDIDDFLDKENKGKAKQEGEQEDASPDKASSPPKDDLMGQIEHIKTLLADKKFEVAETRYVEIREAFNKWTKAHMEEQNKIYVALVNINKDMVNGLNTLRQDTEKNMQRIYELLAKTQQHLGSNEVQVASELFGEIESLFKSLPDISLDKKLKLEHDISAVRVLVRNKSNMVASADFQAKFKNIHNMLTYAFELFKRGQTNQAVQYYHRINTMYDALPVGFLYEKAVLYQQILKLYQSVGSVPGKEPEGAPTAPVEQAVERKNVFGKPVK
jgi:hypothetical protein